MVSLLVSNAEKFNYRENLPKETWKSVRIIEIFELQKSVRIMEIFELRRFELGRVKCIFFCELYRSVEIPLKEIPGVVTLLFTKFLDTQEKTRRQIVNYLVKLIFRGLFVVLKHHLRNITCPQTSEQKVNIFESRRLMVAWNLKNFIGYRSFQSDIVLRNLAEKKGNIWKKDKR